MDAKAFTPVADHELWTEKEERHRMRWEHHFGVEYLEWLELRCKVVRAACLDRKYAILRFRSPSPQRRKRKCEASSPEKNEDPQKQTEDTEPTLEDMLAEEERAQGIF